MRAGFQVPNAKVSTFVLIQKIQLILHKQKKCGKTTFSDAGVADPCSPFATY
jgi:hypothetical protein